MMFKCLPVLLIIISFARVVPAVGPPSARGELIRVKRDLNEQLLLVMESMKKRQRLEEVVKMAIGWIKISAYRFLMPIDKKVEEAKTLREEISRSIHRAYPMRMIFNETNDMLYQVNGLLGGTNEDGMPAKARKAKELLRRSKVGLKKLDDEFKGLVKKTEGLTRDALAYGFKIPDDILKEFGATFSQETDDRNGQRKFNYEIGPEPTEFELCLVFLYTNQIPELSKKQLIQIINLLKNSSNKFFRKINRSKNGAKMSMQSMEEHVKHAEELMRDAKDSGSNNQILVKEYEMILRKVKKQKKLFHDMVAQGKPAMLNLEKYIPILDRAMKEAQDLQDDAVLDEWDHVLSLEVTREILKILESIDVILEGMELYKSNLIFQTNIVTNIVARMNGPANGEDDAPVDDEHDDQRLEQGEGFEDGKGGGEQEVRVDVPEDDKSRQDKRPESDEESANEDGEPEYELEDDDDDQEEYSEPEERDENEVEVEDGIKSYGFTLVAILAICTIWI
ncbi:signal peptide containing protein [Theileria equi strain WA]|uniref:Signal peptide containing protein n=1 Tax=Theileria equi strain WA TaxID=1537102 RepID=L1LB18_THEEQ|nr:signal peptide containing protein [Theileria equi strain WA]EKX72464.1 signal peptide containing protein [Theileria equi strain WA]|eukprot:XP_004831916.1 signal peptide containing protein [Theileria equi strain WA]